MKASHAPPTIVVCNNLETYQPFFSRADPGAQGQRLGGDQALFYCGVDKLVIASTLAAHLDYVRRQLRYSGTTMAAPERATASLCTDILGDARLLDQLVAYAGQERTVQLVPFAATPEFFRLVERLREECGLRVLTPESPGPEALWLRDQMDTKSGFRAWASEWLPDGERRLPQATVCEDPPAAAAAAFEFGSNGSTCVIKPDIGVGGIGQLIVNPGDYPGIGRLTNRLQADPYLCVGTIVVEEMIDSPAGLSPSLEFYVPPAGSGEPVNLYLCQQVFLSSGHFEGVLIDGSSEDVSWYPVMAADGMVIARRLQGLGYAGYFDLDGIVDANGRLYLLEVNTRRTGGTHAHEFAELQFGKGYAQRVTVLALNRLSSGSIATWAQLRKVLDDVLFPQQGAPRGVVVTITSLLEHGEYGCLIVGRSPGDALALFADMHRRVRRAGGEQGEAIRLPVAAPECQWRPTSGTSRPLPQ